MPVVPPSDGRPPLESPIEHVERLMRTGGTGQSAAEPPSLRSVGVIGAGVMGAAIAALNIESKIRVLLLDADRNALEAARSRILAEAQRDTYGFTATDAERLLVLPTSPTALVECDLVLESVVENPEVKRKLYAEIEPHLHWRAILGTNTSTIPIAQLAGNLARPERFCGVHFFHPAGKRSLVEIIRGPATNDATAAAAVAYARQTGKTPIVSADSPGFVVNRMTSAYVGEGLELLQMGVAIEQIDAAATEFGMAMGPVRMLDEIGLDTVLHAGAIMSAAFPDRAVRSPILVQLIKARQLGCKTGAGFLLHSADAPPKPNPRALEIIARWSEPQPPLTPAQILDRLLLPMLLEAARMIEERVVRRPADIDLGVICGLGFPVRQGGLLYWADRQGLPELLARSQALAPLGPRFSPPAIMAAMAKAGDRFADLGDDPTEGAIHPLPSS